MAEARNGFDKITELIKEQQIDLADVNFFIKSIRDQISNEEIYNWLTNSIPDIYQLMLADSSDDAYSFNRFIAFIRTVKHSLNKPSFIAFLQKMNESCDSLSKYFLKRDTLTFAEFIHFLSIDQDLPILINDLFYHPNWNIHFMNLIEEDKKDGRNKSVNLMPFIRVMLQNQTFCLRFNKKELVELVAKNIDINDFMEIAKWNIDRDQRKDPTIVRESSIIIKICETPSFLRLSNSMTINHLIQLSKIRAVYYPLIFRICFTAHRKFVEESSVNDLIKLIGQYKLAIRNLGGTEAKEAELIFGRILTELTPTDFITLAKTNSFAPITLLKMIDTNTQAGIYYRPRAIHFVSLIQQPDKIYELINTNIEVADYLFKIEPSLKMLDNGQCAKALEIKKAEVAFLFEKFEKKKYTFENWDKLNNPDAEKKDLFSVCLSTNSNTLHKQYNHESNKKRKIEMVENNNREGEEKKRNNC